MNAIYQAIGFLLIWSIIIGIGSTISKIIFLWLWRGSKFLWLLFKADEKHHIFQYGNYKFFWKIKFIFKFFFKPTVRSLAFMKKGEAFYNEYFYFSIDEMYVK